MGHPKNRLLQREGGQAGASMQIE